MSRFVEYPGINTQKIVRGYVKNFADSVMDDYALSRSSRRYMTDPDNIFASDPERSVHNRSNHFFDDTATGARFGVSSPHAYYSEYGNYEHGEYILPRIARALSLPTVGGFNIYRRKVKTYKQGKNDMLFNRSLRRSLRSKNR